jgi:hypothetical protein
VHVALLLLDHVMPIRFTSYYMYHQTIFRNFFAAWMLLCVYRTRKIYPSFRLAKPKLLGPQGRHTHNTSIWILFSVSISLRCIRAPGIFWRDSQVESRSSARLITLAGLCVVQTHTVYTPDGPTGRLLRRNCQDYPCTLWAVFYILVVLYRRPTIDNKNSLTSGGIDLLPNHGPDTNAGGEQDKPALYALSRYYMG